LDVASLTSAGAHEAEQSSDQFVDDLFARLHTERHETLARAAVATQSRERVSAAACAWWDNFCQVLERKVHAWNAKNATDARVTCTRNPSGPVTLWHRSVETELRLVEPRVVMTGRIGDTQPRESPFIQFSEARGTVAAILVSDSTAKSPAEAADHVLTPVLTRAFNG
jgi:hypothetical protein